MKSNRQSTSTHVLGSNRSRYFFKLSCIGLALVAGIVFIWSYSDQARAEQSAPETVVADLPAIAPQRPGRKQIDPLPEASMLDLPEQLRSIRQQLGEPDVGGVDPTFNANVAEGTAQGYSLAVQPDGKFLIGGFWHSLNGLNRRSLNRFNPDGTRDETFNPSSTARGPNGSVYEILVLGDGKLMIAGGFSSYNGVPAFRIARLNPDGTLDPTFAAQGTSFNGTVNDIVIQPDGKILASGAFNTFNGTPRIAVARLNADGTLDTGFNPVIGGGNFVEELVLQPDGKIVIGGVFTTVGGVARNSVARLNADGTLDTTFNVGTGVEVDPPTQTPGDVYAADIQPDGKILIGGIFNFYNGVPRTNIARLNTDGSLDTSFAPTISSSIIEFFAIQPDGRILVTGFFGPANAQSGPMIARLTTFGASDTSFNFTAANGSGYVIERQADGKVLVGGSFTQFGGTERQNFVRLDSVGLPDSFAVAIGADPIVYAVEDAGNGKIYIGGRFRRVNGIPRRNIARLNSDGSVDESFDPGLSTGGNIFDFPYVFTMTPQADGKIMVGGFFTRFAGIVRNYVARLNQDGTLDSTFIYQDATFLVRDIEVRPDGKIILAGNFFDPVEQLNHGIVKLNSNGTYDETVVGTGTPNTCTKIAPFPDASGRVFVLGNFANFNGVPRGRIALVNNDGSLDTNFNPGTGFNGTPFSIAFPPPGGLYVGGNFTTYNGAPVTRIARLTFVGNLDTSFATGTGFNATVQTLLHEPGAGNGSLLVGGSFDTYNGAPVRALALLDADGRLDTTFTSQPNNFVNYLARQSDGKPLVGGFFREIGGVVRPGVARLQATAGGNCVTLPINYGQTIVGNLNSGSCVITGPTDVYAFNGTAGDEVAVSLDSLTIPAGQTIELFLIAPGLPPQIHTTTSANARIPLTGYITLPASGGVAVSVSSPTGGFGDYALTVTRRPTAPCNYSVSPTTTNVNPSGGTFYFDVVTGPGCPTVPASLGPNSSHITILSNTGGRVTFNVAAHSGGASRSGTIIIEAGGVESQIAHTINQLGVAPPGNDFFAGAELLPGGSGTVSGHNVNATAEPGEPVHAGTVANRSVWYRWIAPDADLYSFTTSGSTFDTVMAVYTGSSVSTLTRIAENDNTTDFDNTSKINFRTVAGGEYYIAIDGRNGASGSIQLTYDRYRRLYRLYLQTFNGLPSPIVPDSVTAIRQDNTGPTIPATLISLGVYEFDLPNDNSAYVATILGPNGITWVPETYVIENFAGRFDPLMNGPSGGGNNQTTNGTNTIPRLFLGFINGISTPEELAVLGIQISQTGTTTAVPPRPCYDPSDPIPVTPPALIKGGPGGQLRVLYQCRIQPFSTHDITPRAPQRGFQVPVLSLPPYSTDQGPSSAQTITAFNSPTYNIGGRILADGQGLSGVDIDVSAGAFTTRVRSDGTGNYLVSNLAPGQVYTVRARRNGYIFQPQTVNLQPPGATVDFTALTCTYALSGSGSFTAAGGNGQVDVAATVSQSCEWTAVRDGDWISILSGSSVGNGNVQFSVASNTGAARQGAIIVGNQSFPIFQEAGCTFTATLNGPSSFGAGGGAGSFTVAASNESCVAAPTSTDYCMVNFGSLTGSGTLNFTIPPNTGVARTAVVNIGGQTFTLTQAAAAGTHRAKFDFDGDAKSDIALYRPSDGTWYVSQSSAGYANQHWGVAEDKPVAGDYDGDGRTDLAVFRPSSGVWYRLYSSGPIVIDFWGVSSDKPVPGDYDGDGRTDLAVYRPSDGTWYITSSLTGQPTGIQFGIAEDFPVPGDYDGDGRTDIAVFRPSDNQWYRLNSSNGAITAFQFGVAGDKPTPADFDGDGRTDIAVFRPSDRYWYSQNSSNGQYPAIQFGLAGDIPVAADYNGDNLDDIAVYRPSAGVWYIWSCTGNPQTFALLYGVSTDIPVAYPNSP